MPVWNPCSLRRIYPAWTNDFSLFSYCLLAYIRRELYMDSTLGCMRKSFVFNNNNLLMTKYIGDLFLTKFLRLIITNITKRTQTHVTE